MLTPSSDSVMGVCSDVYLLTEKSNALDLLNSNVCHLNVEKIYKVNTIVSFGLLISINSSSNSASIHYS